MLSPLTKITIAYITGIALGSLIKLPILFLTLAVLFLIIASFRYKQLLLALFVLIGAFNFQLHNVPPPQLPLNQQITLTGQVKDEPRFNEEKVFFTVDQVSVMADALPLEYGDQVTISGYLQPIEDLENPGISNYADYLKSRGVYYQLRAGGSPTILGHGGNPFIKMARALNKNLLAATQRSIPEPYATLSISMVFGAGAAKIPPEIKETYKRAGMAHLLVASGMQVGLLAGVCIFAVNLFRLPSWLGVLFSSLANWGFALLAGFGPSIMRAAIMAQTTFLGRLFEREAEIYTSLSLSALVILLFDPASLFDIGCQLSYAATWAMVYISPILLERLKGIPKPLAVAVAGSSAPMLATMPITIYHFGQTSLVALLANIIILPWIGLVVIWGFVAAAATLICGPLGALLNNSNYILLWLAHQIIIFFGGWDKALVYFAPPKLPIVIAYYCSLIISLECLRRGRFPRLTNFRRLTIVLALLIVLLWNSALSDPSGQLVITVLDVGQGDSILIHSPAGNNILIDAGDEKAGKSVVVPFLRRQGINKLDLVVMTHPHDDHAGGLPEVLEQIKVEQVLEPGFDFSSECYRRFLALVRRERIKYSVAGAGQTLDLGGGVKANILHPSPPFLSETNSDANNVSVVFRLEYGDFSMLFTGDTEEEGEQRMLERFNPTALQSTILKAGHHGSRTSTSDDFLAAIRPQAAIISCGRHNRYRHPHQSTLEKLRRKGIRILRTDLSGAVTIRTTGRGYSVETLK